MIRHKQTIFIFIVCIFTTATLAQSQDTNPHPPQRLSTGIGYSSLGSFVEFQYRLNSHDLLNQDKGYIPFSEYGKLNTSIRYYSEKNYLEINKLSILKMLSLSNYRSLTETKSYGFDLGLESVNVYEKDNKFSFNEREQKRITPLNNEVLAGYSFQNNSNQTHSNYNFSILTGIKSQVHPAFNDFFRFGPQIALNFIYDLGKFKINFLSSFQYYNISNNQNDHLNSLKLRYSLSFNQEIRFEISKFYLGHEALISYLYMF
ncbi:MAG: hypothetical protein SH817_03480 [Leptospira sp.]|nr:hypothetical protein [Leptospira sp.]